MDSFDNYFVSKITGNKYCICSNIDLKLFYDELKNNNLTINQYCDLYFKNVAHHKHDRQLKEDEHFIYKNIKLIKESYEKIIVNDHFKCELCENFYASSKSSFGSHIKRKHKCNNLYNYFKKIGYLELNPKDELCGFCNKNSAIYEVVWDDKKRTVEKKYNGYFCGTDECKNNICLEFFKKPYVDAKKDFEHIGGYTEFLCKKYKTDQIGLEKIGKSKKAKNNSRWKSNLHGFILKYGLEKGKEKYEERCKAISRSQKIEWYIEKYGEKEGPLKFFERKEKISKFHKNNNKITSKGQLDLYNLICMEYDNVKLEYPTINGIIDIFIPNKNIIIEFYGDYWHCNPKYYDKNFYHKNLQMFAYEKHIFDENKNRKYLTNIINSKIIIVWESSFNLFKNKLELLTLIKNFIDSNKTVGKILLI